MTDQSLDLHDIDPPADLIDHIARRGVRAEIDPASVAAARAMLKSLAEWADGALVNPTTWERLDLIQVKAWANTYRDVWCDVTIEVPHSDEVLPANTKIYMVKPRAVRTERTEMSLVQLMNEFRPGSYAPPWDWQDEFDDLLPSLLDGPKRELLADIEKHGVNTPVLLGDDGRIWDGHHRISAAVHLGHESIPVEYAKEAQSA